ncbi:MAG: DUF3568 family protein [Sulfuricella sp.]|nr:DUF3568 family protein [Sulfuricella sp.]
MRYSASRIAVLGACFFLLSGCDPISLTMLGVGSGAGVAHTLSGIAYKTFTEPMPKVKKAALVALNRMAIKVSAVEKMEGGEVIKARAADRDIEIELEAISANATRMRATARKNSALMDSATAVEIIIQTEKVLGG